GSIADKRVETIIPVKTAVNVRQLQRVHDLDCKINIILNTNIALLKESLLTATSHQYAGDNTNNSKRKNVLL
ncbi:MAG: hypothetical protein M0Q54_13040, partial [Pigmentiphaga sp.]|nr:hypothetical protein [Pigmentiphaga sp.]